MSKRLAQKITPDIPLLSPYRAFEAIDGRHPWQSAVTEGYVNYPVRCLEKGRVTYFNFHLAREMGLLPPGHPEELNPALEKKILETFAIQIINEFDRENGARIPKRLVKEHPFMATRYLQLQHSDKQGRTSGDGRSIWNGSVRHKGITWDISSRGTGVTCLAPGAVEADRPLKTGAEEFGYGCGLADVSELIGSAVLSEIFYLQGIETERVLTIIDLGKGHGIGVRAAHNLIRPAHLFLYLKQGRLEPLRRATDYLIERQISNGQWTFSPQAPDRYRRMLNEIAHSFARFAARLEREYIFAWIDWDGDNILASAGIIDYGSIRQFGLRHDQYRYDDVDRFSTNLNEQRAKARLTVQVFAQLVNFLETGKRKPIGAFSAHSSVRKFDKEFNRKLREIFLQQVGLDQGQTETLMKRHKALVEKLYSSFLDLEKTKTKSGMKKLPDGINRAAIFNMRKGLRELGAAYAQAPESSNLPLSPEDFFELILASNAKRPDRKLKACMRSRIQLFLKSYHTAINALCGHAFENSRRADTLKKIAERAEKRGRAGRITGNGAEFIIDELLKARRRGLSRNEIQAAIDLFIASQVPATERIARHRGPISLQSNAGRLFKELVSIAHDFEEDI